MINKWLKKICLFSIGKNEKTEVRSGILEERRRLLWLPVAAASAMLFPRRVWPNGISSAFVREGMDWKDFLKDVSPRAKELHKDPSIKGQDAYLYWLASMAARLNFDSIPNGKLRTFANLNPPVETGLAHRGIPFFIIEWKMSANAFLPPHNHPNISVCTLCTQGEARIRNFNPNGKTPAFDSKKEFSVQETHNEILTAGRINTLSAKRDNIHEFRVGKDGARGIDITTYHGKDEGFSFLDIDTKPNDEFNRTYRATWKKF
ncbi:MAG: hypothetical protein HKN25_17360 [Pyrinomonadaceae bacterium]|nr:hypothetical protein [Pyrinomonadaceae bacterium]